MKDRQSQMTNVPCKKFCGKKIVPRQSLLGTKYTHFYIFTGRKGGQKGKQYTGMVQYNKKVQQWITMYLFCHFHMLFSENLQGCQLSSFQNLQHTKLATLNFQCHSFLFSDDTPHPTLFSIYLLCKWLLQMLPKWLISRSKENGPKN